MPDSLFLERHRLTAFMPCRLDTHSASYRKLVQHDLDKERMLETVKRQIT